MRLLIFILALAYAQLPWKVSLVFENVEVVGDNQHKQLLERTAQIGNRVVEELTRFFEYIPQQRIRIFVFPSIGHFARLPEEQQWYFIKNQPYSIRVFYNGSLRSLEEQIRWGITHLYVYHLFSEARFWHRNRYLIPPQWVWLGLPAYIGEGWKPIDESLLFSLKRLPPAKQWGEITPIRYYQKALFKSFWFYIETRYSRRKIQEFFYLLKVAETPYSAAVITFHISFRRLVYEWLKWVKEHYIDPPNEATSEEIPLPRPSKSYLITYAIEPKSQLIAYAYFHKKNIHLAVYSLEKKKHKVLPLKVSFPLNPLFLPELKVSLSWKDKTQLLITLPTLRGYVSYSFYTKEQEWVRRPWRRQLDWVGYTTYDPWQDQWLLIGSYDGQTDAYTLDLRMRKLKPITQDAYDEISITPSPQWWYISVDRDSVYAAYGIYRYYRWKKDSIEKVIQEPWDILQAQPYDTLLIQHTTIHGVPHLAVGIRKIENVTVEKAGIWYPQQDKQQLFYYTFSEWKPVVKKSRLGNHYLLPLSPLAHYRLKYLQRKEPLVLPKSEEILPKDTTPAPKDTYQVYFYIFDEEDYEPPTWEIPQPEQVATTGKKPSKKRQKAPAQGQMKIYANRLELWQSDYKLSLHPLYRLHLFWKIVVRDVRQVHQLQFRLGMYYTLRSGFYGITYRRLDKRWLPWIDGLWENYLLRAPVYLRFQRQALGIIMPLVDNQQHQLRLQAHFQRMERKDLALFDPFQHDTISTGILFQMGYEGALMRYRFKEPYRGWWWQWWIKHFWSSHPAHRFTMLRLQWKRYQPLISPIQWASYAQAGISFGTQPPQFYLGGMQEWVSIRFQNKENLPFYGLPQEILDMQFITPVRGFPYNARRGTKYLLWSNELRIFLNHLFTYWIPQKHDRLLYWFIFHDIGTAWTTGNPFSQRNPVEVRNIYYYPFTIRVQSLKNPFIISTGTGLCIDTSGLRLKITASWLIEDSQLSDFRLDFGFGREF